MADREELLREQLETTLAEFYDDNRCKVARLCDGQLDRSGAMLGRVRERAASLRARAQDPLRAHGGGE